MLKKIFGRKIELEMDELADFLDSNSDKVFLEINSNLMKYNESNKRMIEEISQLLDIITHYNIKSDKLTQVEFYSIKNHLLILNKEVNRLINTISGDMDHQVLKQEVEKIEEMIKDFPTTHKKTLDEVSSHFEEHLMILLSKIEEIRKNYEMIKEIVEKPVIDKYFTLYRRLKKIQDKSARKKIHIEDIKKYEKELSDLKTKITNLENKKKEIKHNEAYKISEKSYTEWQKIKDEIKNKKEKLSNSFSAVIPLLKVYNSKYLERIIIDYINSPIKGLLNDKDLRLTTHLNKIRKLILKKKIIIKKNEADVDNALKLLTKEFLKEKRKEIEELILKKQKKEKLMGKNKIMLELMDIDYQKDHLEKKKIIVEEEIKELDVEQEEMSIDEIKKIIDDIYNYTGKVIKIECQKKK